MSPQGKGRGLAIGLCLLFLISMIPSDIGLVKSPQNLVEDEDVIAPTTPIGQATTLTVGSWPDGANERINVAVGDGYAIKSMELELQPNTLQNSLASAMTDVGDFDDNAVYDGMDVNKSSLQILLKTGVMTLNQGCLHQNGRSQVHRTGRFKQMLDFKVHNLRRQGPSPTTKNPV